MKRLPELSLLLLLLPYSTFAFAADQADWSGGPGVWGPVTSSGTGFLIDTDISWSSAGERSLAPVIIGYPRDESFSNPYSAGAADIDRDGDLDAASASFGQNKIFWRENVASTGISWQEHEVDMMFESPTCAVSSDIDSDETWTL